MCPLLNQRHYSMKYDPSGLGDSEGVELTEARMSSWVEDAREIIIKVSDGPQIIVASSMGCWISSIIAKEHPEKFAGLLMLAPAFNFGEKYEKVLLSQLTPKLLKKYEDGGVVNLYAPDYGEFPLSLAQFEDMKQFNITKATDSMPVTCPVRIIHGIKDKDVPYMESLQLLPALQTPNVTLTYLKHAGHRLSDVTSLDVILDTVLKLASTLHPRENNS
ncbi:Mycophenolic acid acyl-glucuronide esterase-like [Homarus americanus]|uniref:Mycophenolic acid acyl-glucuronide esterase-like n=1 Tax=Homarus americanus TaxID=6706 RepID=A0A8J5N206_HOMAM|nr:Mycophenolic acid acyl-glucuronide esterase-like [Homarus americanus]